MELLWKAMHGLLPESPALHVDETPVRCLKASVTKGTMWAPTEADEGMSLYHWHTSRGRHVLDELLRKGMKPQGVVYGGAFISDGYEGYVSWMRRRTPAMASLPGACETKVCGSGAHGQRPGMESEDGGTHHPALPDRKRTKRKQSPAGSHSGEKRGRIPTDRRSFLEALQERVKQSENPLVNTLRRAILYALARRDTLMMCLKAPQIPIDNNAVERAIRPLAVGRRNSLFIGSPEAGKRAAILYTQVRECQRVKVDSEAWLTAILRRMPDYRGDYLDLLPGMLEQQEAGKIATPAKAQSPSI